MKSPDSYKDKISPQLDTLIKTLLSLFDIFKLSEREILSIDPDLYKSFEAENIPEWISLYISNLSADEIFSGFTGLFPNQLGKLLQSENPMQNPNSPQYAKEILESIKSDPAQGESGLKIWKELGIKEYLKTHILTNILLTFPAVFGEDIIAVLKRAGQGDKKSILKLIQFDKSLIGAEWSQLELRKAQLSGDLEYFRQVAKAIGKAPLRPNRDNMKLTMVLIVSWRWGLKNLTNREIFYYVAKDLKIYGSDDPDSLYRQIKRLGLRKKGEQPA